MTDRTPAARTAYPDSLTEVERVELASAITYHFDRCDDEGMLGLGRDDERATQYEILCSVVERMLRRRAGLI